jgi:CheY-like chemotaxis protein
MLDYAGKGSLATGPVSVNASVEEILHLLRVSIPRPVEVEFHLTPDLPPVEADASQFQQVVMNLITNAAEAIGEVPGKITLSSGVESLTPQVMERWQPSTQLPPGNYVFFQVQDTGSGMTREVRSRMFEPFFTTKFTGRGLGLAAVMGIVRAHRGAIGIESAPGRGTTFRLWLPISTATTEALQSTSPAPPASFSGYVLIVDDEPMVRDVLRRQFEALGMQVATASNGKEALDQFGDHLGDLALVVLDATMPVMGGKETLRELKRRQPSLPVALCSGYDAQAAAGTDESAHADAYLKKPVQLNELRAVLHNLLH